jgi:hypothetical protein
LIRPSGAAASRHAPESTQKSDSGTGDFVAPSNVYLTMLQRCEQDQASAMEATSRTLNPWRDSSGNGGCGSGDTLAEAERV